MKIIIALVVLAAIAALILAAQKKSGPRVGAYKPRRLMTANEEEFFGRLVAALPERYVFPQVAMSAMLEAAISDKKQAHSDRLRIAQQRADYVICDSQCNIVAVVELDDRRHSSAKDQTRDARLEQAGIRTIRFQSRTEPSITEIQAAFAPKAVEPNGSSVLTWLGTAQQ